MKKLITLKEIDKFKENLILEEMSAATVEKYVRDVRTFAEYASGETINKETVIAYKKHLQESYAVRSVNSMLAGINQFFEFNEYSGWFYISCPVIWKSLFRSVFVHTEL